MAPEWSIVGGVVVVFIVLQLYLVKRRWDKLGRAAEGLRRARGRHWRRLRRIGRQSLHLRRERAKAVRHKERLIDAISRLNRLLQVNQAKRPERLFVLDDRRTPRDLDFAVTVRHPKFELVVPDATDEAVQSWLMGRRLVVWAVDEQRALAKVEQRLPAARGYQILQIAADSEPADPGASETAEA